jgi:hypothetical protein
MTNLKIVGEVAQVPMTAAELLEKLQYKQLRHDELYHSDICLLRIQARIAHHTLHLGKYSGKMAQALVAQEGVDVPGLVKTVLDALIIVMSSANTLNLALWKVTGTEDDLQGALDGSWVPGDLQAHILSYVIIVGKLAKAVEALDHVESFDSRAAYEYNLKSLWIVLLKFWRLVTDQPLEHALIDRMVSIESKNMYYRRQLKYVDDYCKAV